MICCDDKDYLDRVKILDFKVRRFSEYMKKAETPIELDCDFVRRIFDITAKKTIPNYLREMLAEEGILVRVLKNGATARFVLKD